MIRLCFLFAILRLGSSVYWTNGWANMYWYENEKTGLVGVGCNAHIPSGYPDRKVTKFKLFRKPYNGEKRMLHTSIDVNNGTEAYGSGLISHSFANNYINLVWSLNDPHESRTPFGQWGCVVWGTSNTLMWVTYGTLDTPVLAGKFVY